VVYTEETIKNAWSESVNYALVCELAKTRRGEAWAAPDGEGRGRMVTGR